MADHISFIRQLASKSLAAINAELKTCEMLAEKSNITQQPKFAIIAGLQEEYIKLNGANLLIRRVFAMCNDSGDYANVGWVLSDDVSCCMICKLYLGGVFSVRHHCRACGNVICDNCGNSSAIIKELQSVGPVRVCIQCNWGQEEIGINTNNRDIKFRNKIQTDESLSRVWKYGPVIPVKVFPGFVIRTKRADQSTVYVNICSSDCVPYNMVERTASTPRKAPISMKDQRLYLVCGSKGITLEGADVYDVVLHTNVLKNCQTDLLGVTKEKICQEVLLSIPELQLAESDFKIFQYQQIALDNVSTSSAMMTYKERVLTAEEKNNYEDDRAKVAKNMRAAALAAAAAMNRKSNSTFSRLSSLRSNSNHTAAGSKAKSIFEIGIATDDDDDIETDANATSANGGGGGSLDMVIIPMPSIAAFFHMEQIAVSRSDQQEPPGGKHEKRWQKYKLIVQSPADGSLFCPRTKKTKAASPQSTPAVLLTETNKLALESGNNNNNGSSSSNNKARMMTVVKSVTISAYPAFVVHANRVNAAKNGNVIVNVVHHPTLDDMVRTGFVNIDEVGFPFVLISTATAKAVRRDNSVNNVNGNNSSSSNGTSATVSRVYSVAVGSEFCVSPGRNRNNFTADQDLTGRRITSKECIQKILHCLNVQFIDEIDVNDYTLSQLGTSPEKAMAGPLVSYICNTTLSSATTVAAASRTPFSITPPSLASMMIRPTAATTTSSPRTPTSINSSSSSSSIGSRANIPFARSGSGAAFGGIALYTVPESEYNEENAAEDVSDDPFSAAFGRSSTNDAAVAGIAASDTGSGASAGSRYAVGLSELRQLRLEIDTSLSPTTAAATSGLNTNSSSQYMLLPPTGKMDSNQTPRSYHNTSMNNMTTTTATSPSYFGRGGNFSRSVSTSTTATATSDNGDVSSSAASTPRKLSKTFFSSSTDKNGNPTNHKNTGVKIQGRSMLTDKMVEYLPQLAVNRAVCEGLKKQSAKDPQILLGWQVVVPPEKKSQQQQASDAVYVITAIRKDFMGRAEYRLSNFVCDDMWTRLKKNGGGVDGPSNSGTGAATGGTDFIPVRKVLNAVE